jgi:hypothetical protein
MADTFTCRQCGQKAPIRLNGAGGKRTAYCSPECQGKANRKGEEHPCPICGAPVYSKASKPQKYCSTACMYQGRQYPAQRKSRLGYQPKTLVCRTCGKEVPARGPGGNRTAFCSNECAQAARRVLAERVCEVCGTTFHPREADRRFCSHACSVQGKAKRVFTMHSRIHPAGYKMLWLPGHPRASDGYVMEHILVAESKLGRPITRDEHVHHINGDKLDNQPENLEVMTNSEHQKLHQRQRHNQE